MYLCKGLDRRSLWRYDRKKHHTIHKQIVFVIYSTSLLLIVVGFCAVRKSLGYRHRNQLEIELRFVFNQHRLHFPNALLGSGTSINIIPTSMKFSVIKIRLPEAGSTVVDYCVTVSGAEKVELIKWEDNAYRQITNFISLYDVSIWGEYIYICTYMYMYR